MAEQKVGITLAVNDQVSKTVDSLAKKAKFVGKAFGGVVSVVKGVGGAIVVANQAAELLSKGFNTVKAAIGGAVDAAVEMRGESDPLIRKFKSMGSAVKGIQGAFGTSLILAFTAIGKALQPLIKRVKEFAEKNKEVIAKKTVDLVMDFALALADGIPAAIVFASLAITKFRKGLNNLDSFMASLLGGFAEFQIAIHDSMGRFSPFSDEAVNTMRFASDAAVEVIAKNLKANDELDIKQKELEEQTKNLGGALKDVLTKGAKDANKALKELAKGTGTTPFVTAEEQTARLRDQISKMVPDMQKAMKAIGEGKTFEQGRLAYEQLEKQIDLASRSLQFASKDSLPGVISQVEKLYKAAGLEFPFEFNTNNIEATGEQLQTLLDFMETFALDGKEGINLLNDAFEQQIDVVKNFKAEFEQAPVLLSNFAEEAGSAFAKIAQGAVTAGEAFGQLALSLVTSLIDMVQKAVLAYAVQAAAAAMANNSSAPGIGLIIGAAMGAAALGMVKGLLSQIPKPEGYADGGFVTGGVPNRDSVPALLMPGEFVIPKKQVDAMRNGQGGAGGGTNIQINTTVPPNRGEMKRYIRQNLIPAMRELKSQGVMV